MTIKFYISFLPVFLANFLFAQNAGYPFPQHGIYYPGVIYPNHISTKEKDDSVIQFYFQWKNRYIRKSNCSEDLYVWSENAGKNNESVSEGQGYGMIIVAYMAGADPKAQTTYNGLFNYYKEHPSSRNPWLMSWAQKKTCVNRKLSSASDGDIDIAYSLLLADAQWSSAGKINYASEARHMIDAIQNQEINAATATILESNDVESDSRDYNDMRSSDFIPSEMRAFFNASKNTEWLKSIDSCYKVFDRMQKAYSPEAGLVPDFIQGIGKNPRPAKSYYLESKYDGFYNYNACRVPWRIASDYITCGEERSRKFLEPVNKWIQETCSGNPDNISAGYSLAGDDLRSRHFEALSFISSFAVSAMVDKKNQEWLNKLWDYMIRFKLKDFDYFDNSIKLYTLIILSGNYWLPS
jgi:endo-1,4-beta-D-glucanase Y